LVGALHRTHRARAFASKELVTGCGRGAEQGEEKLCEEF
jgi:hypothetical protein